MATTINLTRPSGGDLVVYGAKAVGTPSLIEGGLSLPQPAPEVVFAPSAPWLAGEVPASLRFPNAVLGMRVRLEAATEDAHQVLVADFRAALQQLTYQATVALGGNTDTWTCYPGSMVLTNDARATQYAGRPVIDWYTITIPVNPNKVV